MTPDTRVHVGSVAKTVLAIGVPRLVTTGKLTLDTAVAPLLPGLQFDHPWQASDPIRVRHLLEHTAGLENFRFSQAFSLRAGADTPLLEAFGDTRSLTVRSRPGARYAYSTIGYHLLGMVIDAVAGTRYEAYLDTELLRPLGMHDSTFAYTGQTGRKPIRAWQWDTLKMASPSRRCRSTPVPPSSSRPPPTIWGVLHNF